VVPVEKQVMTLAEGARKLEGLLKEGEELCVKSPEDAPKIKKDLVSAVSAFSDGAKKQVRSALDHVLKQTDDLKDIDKKLDELDDTSMDFTFIGKASSKSLLASIRNLLNPVKNFQRLCEKFTSDSEEEDTYEDRSSPGYN